MATLAKELAARGHRLVDPYKEHKAKALELGVHFEDLEEAEDHKYSDGEESEYNTEEETATMSTKKATASPSSAMKKKAFYHHWWCRCSDC
jgi:hypothetical protein